MSSEQNGEGGMSQEADFAQAFNDLARGERAAAALENHLDSLEKKIEELLAKADEEDRKLAKSKAASKDADNEASTDEQSKESA